MIINTETVVNDIKFDITFNTDWAPATAKRMILTDFAVVMEQLNIVLESVNRDNIEAYNKGAKWCLVSIKD